jgi:hypothetical protein
MAWEGERTVTFTMEDALISPAGFMILSGAGLIEASDDSPIIVHTTEQTNKVTVNKEEGYAEITLSDYPHFENDGEDYIYVMLLDDRGEVATEPFIATAEKDSYKIKVQAEWVDNGRGETAKDKNRTNDLFDEKEKIGRAFSDGCVVLVDYYVARTGGASEIVITPDKFGGYYYLEASTLFRNTDGVDMPAEFVIPNCKIQSNFSFTMASSGDPSTFTFTIDAFPDYTRFDRTKKVLAAIQIVTEAEGGEELRRIKTMSEDIVDVHGMIDRVNG